jgi:hypothetical protein
MRWKFLVCACALSAIPLAALAAGQTDIGVLTCTLAVGGEQTSEPETQTRAMLCAFKPNGGPEESYSGEIRKVGSQTALSGKMVLIWAVMGPSKRDLKPAALEQTYVGEATTPGDDPSAPPKMLIGERDKAYGLRSITDKGEPNPGQTITVVDLKIKTIPS